MLAAAMEALLSPLFDPKRLKFELLQSPQPVGTYLPARSIAYPRDSSATTITPEELVAAALYVLCYQPMHRDAAEFRRLALAYINEYDPAWAPTLMAEAQESSIDGDWVGAVGRLWTVVQIEPSSPDALDQLAVTCLRFGPGAAKRGYLAHAIGLAQASAAAFNALQERFPLFGPGHFHRAEFLLLSGNQAGAVAALREAARLGLPEEMAMEATTILQQLLAH